MITEIYQLRLLKGIDSLDFQFRSRLEVYTLFVLTKCLAVEQLYWVKILTSLEQYMKRRASGHLLPNLYPRFSEWIITIICITQCCRKRNDLLLVIREYNISLPHIFHCFPIASFFFFIVSLVL